MIEKQGFPLESCIASDTPILSNPNRESVWVFANLFHNGSGSGRHDFYYFVSGRIAFKCFEFGFGFESCGSFSVSHDFSVERPEYFF